MKNYFRQPRLPLLLVLCAGLIAGASYSSADDAAKKSASEMIRASLTQRLPGLQIDDVQPTPVTGLYEVTLGPRVVYMSEDGRYLVSGVISDLETGNNLTEPKLAAAKLKAVQEVGEENMVVFGPKDAKHEVNVFTDIDCGYCRKLHSEMEGYNAAGIRIRYLFYPRAGVGSESYQKAVSVWCADDRSGAMTAAKSGESVPNKNCENTVDEHMMLGQLLGLNGTPALILDNGETIPGYVPPEKLIKILEQ